VQTKALSPDEQPVLITRSEFMRRMKEMQSIQGGQFGSFGDMYNVVVNTNHHLVANRLLKIEDETAARDLAAYLYQLALLNQGMLKGAELAAFTAQSLKMVE